LADRSDLILAITAAVYLVERNLESKAALDALIADYLTTSRRRGAPGAMRPTVEILAEGAGDQDAA